MINIDQKIKLLTFLNPFSPNIQYATFNQKGLPKSIPCQYKNYRRKFMTPKIPNLLNL